MAVAQGKFKLQKISGSTNPADVCTKYQSLRDMQEKLSRVNVCVEEEVRRGALGQ